MTRGTLQAKVNSILVLTFFVVAGAATVLTYAYSEVQKKWSINRISEDLLRTSADQAESLLTSYLLPEQQAGVPLLLERIGKAEKLDQISVLKSQSDVAATFPECAKAVLPASCSSLDGSRIGAITPIGIPEKTFGLLFKVKKKESQFISDNWVQTLEAAGLLMLVAFVILFWRLYDLMSKRVPREHAETLKWIEADLNGQSSQAPESSFCELKELRNGISEILERYEKSRDQAVVGQLTSGIMHDLKTPLSSVVTASMLASEQVVGSEKRLARLENLLSVCQARLPVIGGIIETTLDGSREIHIEKKDADIRETVSEALNLTAELIQLRKTEVKLEESVDTNSVPHDPIQLSRVLTNLIKNAIEASGAGSKICIGISDSNANNILVSVDDNGPGLGEKPHNVFRVFRSTKSHGSGLGLLVSRKIVEAHKGSLSYSRSKRLGGARFEVTLPKSAMTSEVSL